MKHTKWYLCFLLILASFLVFSTFSCKREISQTNNQKQEKKKENNKEEEQNNELTTKAKIEFGSDISCTKGGTFGLGVTPVQSGEEVEVDMLLSFKVKVTGTITVKAWSINDENLENQTKTTFNYKVAQKDIKEGKIKIGVQKNLGHPIVVEFAQNIACSKATGILSSEKVESGSNVEIGDVLTFTGKAQKGKVIDKWAINNNEKVSGKTYTYTVNKDDAVMAENNLFLRISFSERKLKELTLNFDIQKVQCNEEGTFLSSGKPIPHGAKVLEDSKIVFTAIRGEYEDVKDWNINGKNKANRVNSFVYTVDIKDIPNPENSDIIEVSWTVSHRIKVEFNKNRITCKTKSLVGLLESEVKSGTFHPEQTKLYLYPKLADGEKLEGWYLNGKKYTSLGSLFLDNIIYSVSNDDAKDKDGARYIEITTKTEFPPRVIIRYDESKLSCTTAQERPVANGSSVFDREKLIFTSIMGENKAVEKWFVNDKEAKINVSPKRFEYVVYASQAKPEGNQKVMEIKIKEMTLQQLKIKYDTNLVKCTNENDEPINTDTLLYEATELTLTAKIANGMTIEHWQAGKKKINQDKKTIKYLLSSADSQVVAGESVVEISYEIKEQIAIKFDPAKITCEVSDGGWFLPKYTAVQNGQKIDVGSYLRFYAITPDQASFDRWLVNGQEKSGNKDYKRFTYTVNTQDAKGQGNDKEIEVTIKTK